MANGRFVAFLLKPLHARGIDIVGIMCLLDGVSKPRELQEVLYVPTLPSNLFSVLRAPSQGIDTICSKSTSSLV